MCAWLTFPDSIMDRSDLRGDCARCAGLCCMALAFDRSALFAADKPAGVACPNLNDGDRCRIHAKLGEAGFAGCVRYDCAGAGQHATRLLRPGHWRDGPAHRAAAISVFRILRRVHDLVALLMALEALPLSVAQRRRRRVLIRQLWPDEGWTLTRLAAFERSDLEHQVRAFLIALAETAVAAGLRPDQPVASGLGANMPATKVKTGAARPASRVLKAPCSRKTDPDSV